MRSQSRVTDESNDSAATGSIQPSKSKRRTPKDPGKAPTVAEQPTLRMTLQELRKSLKLFASSEPLKVNKSILLPTLAYYTADRLQNKISPFPDNVKALRQHVIAAKLPPKEMLLVNRNTCHSLLRTYWRESFLLRNLLWNAATSDHSSPGIANPNDQLDILIEAIGVPVYISPSLAIAEPIDPQTGLPRCVSPEEVQLMLNNDNSPTYNARLRLAADAVDHLVIEDRLIDLFGFIYTDQDRLVHTHDGQSFRISKQQGLLLGSLLSAPTHKLSHEELNDLGVGNITSCLRYLKEAFECNSASLPNIINQNGYLVLNRLSGR